MIDVVHDGSLGDDPSQGTPSPRDAKPKGRQPMPKLKILSPPRQEIAPQPLFNSATGA